jgi:opacity protein-like surface antigen
MLKRFLAVAAFAAMLIPSSAFAVDHSKQWALGYFFDDAPIGVRYMMSPKLGLDAGLGYNASEGPDFSSSDPSATSTNGQFSFELGLQYNLVKTDRADFFVRPFFGMTTVPYYLDNGTDPTTSESVTDTRFGAMLGAEWHATDNLSLSFGHGLGVTSGHGVDAGDLRGAEPDASTSIQTVGLTTGASSIGFRWYF